MSSHRPRSTRQRAQLHSASVVPLAFLLLVAGTLGCRDDSVVTAPPPVSASPDLTTGAATPQEVRTLAALKNVGPLLRPAPVRPALVLLGQMLAFDKELSGNRDIACMTCHLPAFGTGDGRSLSVGQGATGLGPARSRPDGALIPRNAPSVFNLAALDVLFWDGRVSVDAKGRFHSPADGPLTPDMTRVMEFGASSALALFPVTNRAEMRGDVGSNELANLDDDDFQGMWRGLMRRLGRIPEYRALFEAAYPGQKFEQMSFAHASNAIAGFFAQEFFFNDTPWDRFLGNGVVPPDDDALTQAQLEGAKTFLSIRCVQCHNGPTLSDGKFHNVALAQVGPGVGDGVGGHDDFGRFRVSGKAADRYAFRTTPLRNVEFTAPYGHAGELTDLRAFIDHYSESHLKLRNYDVAQLDPALQGTLVQNFDDILATRDPILDGVVLTDDIVDNLRTYMLALSDAAAKDLSHTIPARVPSGLPVDR